MKILPLLLLVPLVAGAQDVGLPFFAADDSAASSLPSLPQPGNITMSWDSRYAPVGRTTVWRDLTNNVPMVVVNSNSSYMYNTPDGMIMGSGVANNNGQARVKNPNSVSLGTNWSVWFTYKREDLETTRKIGFSAGNAEMMSYNQWIHFWNMSSPSEIALGSNHTVSVWTDVLVTQTNNATYTAYLDGVFMTNQTRSAAASLDTMGWPTGAGASQFMGKMGQCIAWTNTVLTAADAATLHQRLTNTMFNLPGMSNALPSTSGLRNAWRTAGFTGRLFPNWTDYVSGKTFTQWSGNPDPAGVDNTPIATGRGFRSWSPEGAIHIRSSWYSGNMTMPSTYTMCMVFTPMIATPTDTSPLIYTAGGSQLVWSGTDQQLKWNGFGGANLSPVLGFNRTHTIFNVYNGTSSLWFIDGQYYTNLASAAINGDTISTLGNYLSIPNFSFCFQGYIPELLVYTNISFSTNDAVAYNTYATNQYGFDWYGGTNAYGDLFTCTNYATWSSPILQQQLLDNNWSSIGSGWFGQKIKNTSSTPVRVKAVRFKTQNDGGATGQSIYAFCVTNTATAGSPTSTDMYGGYSITNISATTLSGPVIWETFTWLPGDEPVIPANTDFIIAWKASASGLRVIYQRNIGTGNAYQNTTYCLYSNSGGDSGNDDLAFEIYTCQ